MSGKPPIPGARGTGTGTPYGKKTREEDLENITTPGKAVSLSQYEDSMSGDVSDEGDITPQMMAGQSRAAIPFSKGEADFRYSASVSPSCQVEESKDMDFPEISPIGKQSDRTHSPHMSNLFSPEKVDDSDEMRSSMGHSSHRSNASLSDGSETLRREAAFGSTTLTSPKQSKRSTTRVFCRFRPLARDEGTGTCVKFLSDRKSVVVKDASSKHKKELKFAFGHIFRPSEQQGVIYDRIALPILDDVLEGYNGTIMAYGQTSTGEDLYHGRSDFGRFVFRFHFVASCEDGYGEGRVDSSL